MAYMVDGNDTALDVDAAMGTLTECLERDDITGSFDAYRFSVANGRQVLLGHHSLGSVQPGNVAELAAPGRDVGTAVNTVFVTRDSAQPRSAGSWEELRSLLRDDWVIGTARHPGVKNDFRDNGRNYRREADRILVHYERTCSSGLVSLETSSGLVCIPSGIEGNRSRVHPAAGRSQRYIRGYCGAEVAQLDASTDVSPIQAATIHSFRFHFFFAEVN